MLFNRTRAGRRCVGPKVVGVGVIAIWLVIEAVLILVRLDSLLEAEEDL